MVIWIMGLSGAGKTTLAQKVFLDCKKEIPNVVLVDGDEVREMFGNDLGYSLEDRRKNAERICRIGKFLSDQGIHVVCAILSLFPESREWNRRNIKNYFEVFIDTPLEDLQSRDPKGIYSRYLRGEIRDVAGLDLEFVAPEADLVIHNAGARSNLLSFSSAIAEKIVKS